MTQRVREGIPRKDTRERDKHLFLLHSHFSTFGYKEFYE